MLCNNSEVKASLLSLLHCSRVCQSCVDQHQDFLPLRADFAKEISDLAHVDLAHIPVARLDFDPTDELRRQVQSSSGPPGCKKDGVKPHTVVSLSSVAKLAAEKQNVSADPELWAKLRRKRVQENLQANYFHYELHSYCTTCCLLPQKLDLEPHIGVPVKVEALYAAMILHWASRDSTARRAIVMPVPMAGEGDVA
jgi:hypothetical protein